MASLLYKKKVWQRSIISKRGGGGGFFLKVGSPSNAGSPTWIRPTFSHTNGRSIKNVIGVPGPELSSTF